MKNRLAGLSPFRRTAATAGGLIATTVLTSATGAVFWWVAARSFSRDSVGLAAAAVSAMILLSQIAELGLGTKLVGVLHRDERPRALAATAVVVSGLSAIALSLAFILFAPIFIPELGSLASHPLPAVIFVVGVALSTAGSIMDQVMAAVSQNIRRLVRNTVFAFGRLALLPLVAVLLLNDGVAIYGAWVAGIALSFLVLLAPARARNGRELLPLPWRALSRMAGDSMSHHVINLARSSSLWLLPLIVTTLLSKEANASFYVALLLANFLALVGSSATFTLYIVAAQVPNSIRQQIRFTLGLSTVAVALGTAFFAIFGVGVLSVFGESYASAGYPAIVILAATTLPVAVKDHWISLHRINGRVRRAAVVGIGCLALELLASGLGAALGGIAGLAVLRLFAVTLQAVLMVPAVIRAMWQSPAATVAPAVVPGSVDPAGLDQ